MRDVARFASQAMSDAAQATMAFESVRVDTRGTDGFYSATYRGETVSVPIGSTDVPAGSWLLCTRTTGGGFTPFGPSAIGYGE